MEARALRKWLIANMLFALGLLVVLVLEAFGVINMFSHAAGARWLFSALLAAFLVFNGLYIVERYVLQRATHLKTRAGDQVFQVAIGAVEESLGRIARCIPDVHDARVFVTKDRKDRKPLVIEVSCIVYEETPIPPLTERIRQVVAHRFDEIVGPDLKPEIHINLTRIVEKEARPRPRGSKETKVVDLSKGPVYPVTDDLPS
jgi:hypothetical protein